MCGIAGLLDTTVTVAEREEVVRRMTASVAHRGPDACGTFADASVALGHRRLSILDLSPTGAQPMSLGAGQPVISYNGEVYNFAELKQELAAAGRAFRGGSDTEVILHAYAHWGLEGLKRLEGIFAFGLWDPAQQRLVLMRDRFGVKPLFYRAGGGRLVFGSEIKALFAAGGAGNDIDEQSFSEYLWYGNAYGDRTIYRDVRSLLPGHWLVVEDGRQSIAPWWTIEEWTRDGEFRGTEADAIAAVRDAVDAAVKRQLVADVPVSLFLSGGIDSSAIAASAMRVQDRPLRSYTVHFDAGQGGDDLSRARAVAAHLGLEHHEFRVGGGDLQALLRELARSHDEPFADAANIPLCLLAREFRGQGKVVLQGDGGDEMFAGYRQYSFLDLARYARALPDPILSAADFGLGNYGARMARIARALKAPDPAMQMAMLLTMETLRDPPTDLLTDAARTNLAARTDPFLGYRECAARFAGAPALQKMLLTDLMLQLPSQFLPKVDRATMLAGVEARVPLLDEKVARLAVSLPMKWKVSGFKRKVILRKALKGRIPNHILEAPKSGFGVPYQRWLATSLQEFAKGLILEPRFVARFGFDAKELETALADLKETPTRRGFTMWKVFQLALWASEYP